MIRSIRPGSLDWNAKGPDRVAQNVRNLLSLTQYEVAYNRLLGMPAGVADQLAEDAARQAAQAAREMIRRFEPRAKVTDVTPALDEVGNLVLEVEINLD